MAAYTIRTRMVNVYVLYYSKELYSVYCILYVIIKNDENKNKK